MPRICQNCGKGSQIEWKRKLLRGHYNPTHKKRKYPNLQKVRTSEGNRIRVCTECIRNWAKTATKNK